MILSVAQINRQQIFYYLLGFYFLFYSLVETPYLSVVYQNLEIPGISPLGLFQVWGGLWHVYILQSLKILGALFLFSEKFRAKALSCIFVGSLLLTPFLVEGSPEQAFLNLMCLILIFKESLKIKELKDVKNLNFSVWFVFGLAYSISGYYKLMTESWFKGEFMMNLTLNHMFKDSFLFLSGYPATLEFFTYFSLFSELLALPFCLFPKTRSIAFVSLSLFHVGALFMVDLYQVSFGMLLFHLFLYLNFKKDQPASQPTNQPTNQLV